MMRRLTTLMFLAGLALLLLPGGAAALSCSEPDLIAVVFDNNDINLSPTYGAIFSLRVVLMNPVADQIDAFEFTLTEPGADGNLFKLSETLPPYSINIGNSAGFPAEYVVGCGAPVPASGGQIVLVTMQLMSLQSSQQRDFFISPTSVPSVPGHVAYNRPLDGGNAELRIMNPISGDFALPIARLYPQTPLNYCTFDPLFSVTIAGEGESIVAGVLSGATDGYDDGIDAVDSTPNLQFPRAEWPGTGMHPYRTDLRAPYDPTVTSKVWSFRSTPAAGGGWFVDLSFTPSFPMAAGVGLKLRDFTTGQVVDLMATGLQYSYYSDAPRYFELEIGTVAPAYPALAVDVVASCGSVQTAPALAATDADATDGFDPDTDLPLPAPPPGGYVAASFEHPDWPLGPRFRIDTRSLYDALSTRATWPLLVETDLQGWVQLTFAPDFAAGEGVDLQLQDLTTGATYDLFPTLSYTFYNQGVATARRFLLSIGHSEPPELQPTHRVLPAGWSLVGLPLTPTAGANTLGSVLLQYSPGYAYAYTYARATGYQLASRQATAATGTGYWLGTTAGYDWTMNGARALDGLTVPLANGWNLVGNANWFPGPFEGLRVLHGGNLYTWLDAVAAGLVSADVQSYDAATGAYFDATDLQPWQAYWINALVDGATLRFDWQSFQQLPARLVAPPATAKATGASWRSDLVLTDAQQRTRAVTFGVEAVATAGFDPAFDRPQPPASPAGGPTLSFLHPEWALAAGNGFTRDLVGPSDEPVHWTAALTAPQAGTATLSWQPADWPDGADFQLYFPHENRVAVMSMRHQTSLAVRVGPQPLMVVVRTPDLASAVGDVAAGDYSLSAQPNPFNPATTVSFALPQAGRAEVRLYTVRGELVQVLGGRDYEAGRHQEVWNGHDRQGHAVPSGAYFGRLYVDGQARGKVLRLSLVR
jgi:hypothetical protein